MKYNRTAVDFGKTLATIARERMGDALRQKQKQTARELLQKILQGHPTDTGYSKSNWRASLHTPDFTTIDTIMSEADQMAALEHVLSKLDEAPPNSTLYLCNGVSYVSILENGHSSKAPEGFIALAIESVKSGGKS